ncbi:MAG: 3'-5' exonuclease [Myxococcales bacterium]|nr:3'-5' exonuclease [Myxococcales bacterium]
MNGRSTRLRPETLALLRQRLAEMERDRSVTRGHEAPREGAAPLGPVVPPEGGVRRPVLGPWDAALDAPSAPVLKPSPTPLVRPSGQLVLPTLGAQLGALAGTTAKVQGSRVGAVAQAAKQPRGGRAPKAVQVIHWPDELVVVDTETTGTSRLARLVEIGAVRLRHGQVVETWQSFVHPEQKIPPEVIAVHGITDAMVVGAPRALEALAGFVKWVGGASLIAHNAAFDRRIFQQEFARVGAVPPGLPMFCSLRLARRAFPGLGRYGLGALAQHFGIVVTQAHRALADCITTAQVIQHAMVKHTGPQLGAFHGPARVL